jgi:hypothetical protein
MARLKVLCGIFAAIAGFAIASSALAHREPESLTTIKWNGASGRTEIVHRLHAHDAELGVGRSLGLPALSVSDLEGRAHIALYVEAHFHIRSNGQPLKLDLLGAERSGDHVFVYQETSARLPASIEVYDDILRGAFPRQVNQVIIEDGDAEYRLMFTPDDGWLGYEFHGQAADK